MTIPASHPSGIVLAIAVFGESASVALRRGDAPDELAVVTENVAQSHSARLLPLVSGLMARTASRPADLAGVAFEAGPGGFTSLRVACAMAQGLGIALGIPVCPVGTLEAAAVALALGPAATQGGKGMGESPVFVANDARMGECYFGVFAPAVQAACNRAAVSTLLEPGCAGPEQVVAALEHWARRHPGLRFTGDAQHRHPDLRDALVRLGIAPVDTRADAAAIAMIAADLATSWLDPADAAPRYVREKVALDVDEQRALRAAGA